jgi:hypothetical protein
MFKSQQAIVEHAQKEITGFAVSKIPASLSAQQGIVGRCLSWENVAFFAALGRLRGLIIGKGIFMVAEEFLGGLGRRLRRIVLERSANRSRLGAQTQNLVGDCGRHSDRRWLRSEEGEVN